jgi:glyoxylase-like metal-dependent hydrolase (beta-lactamase superfamily II)
MRIISVCERSFGANTYLLLSGNQALVVDPAVSVASIVDAATSEGAFIVGVLLTHGHFDHLLSLDTICKDLNIPSYIHENDAEMLTDGKKNALMISNLSGKTQELDLEGVDLTDARIDTIDNERLLWWTPNADKIEYNAVLLIEW